MIETLPDELLDNPKVGRANGSYAFVPVALGFAASPCWRRMTALAHLRLLLT